MNEPMLVPNIKAVPNTRDINPASVLDGGLVRFVLQHERVNDAITVVNEMHVIVGQRPPPSRAAWSAEHGVCS